ncbi:MAG: response regulator transcription factor [bacterium]
MISTIPLTQKIKQKNKITCYRSSTVLKNLTFQEIKILKLIALGYTTKEIAEILYLSSRTVEVHRRNIFKKLNITKRHQLVKIFIESGLILSELPCFKNKAYCHENKILCPKCGIFIPKQPK